MQTEDLKSSSPDWIQLKYWLTHASNHWSCFEPTAELSFLRYDSKNPSTYLPMTGVSEDSCHKFSRANQVRSSAADRPDFSHRCFLFFELLLLSDNPTNRFFFFYTSSPADRCLHLCVFSVFWYPAAQPIAVFVLCCFCCLFLIQFWCFFVW